MKAHTNEQIDKLTIQINDLEITDTAFEKYVRFGMSLLKDLTWYFQEANPEVKRKLLGSIFPAKLIFEDGKYRTGTLNPALALILQKNRGLQNEKAEDIVAFENVSGDVAKTGIEPATQGFSVLKSCFRILPWIALNQPRCLNSLEKSKSFPENIDNRRPFISR